MIPFSPPRIDAKIINEVVDTLKSGWITTGPKTKLFEKKLQDFTGAEKVLCLNSATVGLELMLRWYGIGEGDEVILPAYTYAATANVVVHCGAKPVFVDIGEDFNISVQAIEKALTEHTKAVMPVDIGGYPCDYDDIKQLLASHKTTAKFQAQTTAQQQLGRPLLIADAAHSLGAWYKNKRSGHKSIADLTVFSFHAVKNLTTAEGGAVCLNMPPPFNNEEIYNKLCISALHGQDKDAFQKTKNGNWRYDIVEAGYKINMTDIQAAIGVVEIDRYDNDMLPKRKAIFEKYVNGFKSKRWAILPAVENKDKVTSFHAFMLRIKNITEEQRDIIIQEIFNAGVSVNVHFIPLPMMSFYKNKGYKISDYPATYKHYACEISLPVYYSLSNEDVDKVIAAVTAAVEKQI